MIRENAVRIAGALPDSATVLDVGGGYAPFPRATHVIDATAFDDRGGCIGHLLEDVIPARYTRENWVVADVCDHRPWPFADKFFDYSTCSHLLEDVRDPIWVCSELQRVSKAGYIEVPSRILEQCLGVENPTYAGYYHHRWLVNIGGGRIAFQHKPHNMHSLKSAIVARLGANEKLNPQYATDSLEWIGSFEYSEKLILDQSEVERDLAGFAGKSRHLPGLVIRSEGKLLDRARRSLYYARLSRNSR